MQLNPSLPLLRQLARGLGFTLAGYLFRHESKRAITGSGSPLVSALGSRNLGEEIEKGNLRGLCQGLYRTNGQYLEGLPGYWTGLAARAEMDFARNTALDISKDWPRELLNKIAQNLSANYTRYYQR